MSRNPVPGPDTQSDSPAAPIAGPGIRQWVPKLIVADLAAATPATTPPAGSDPAAVAAAVPEALPVQEVPVPAAPPPVLEPVPPELDPILLDQARSEGYALGLEAGRRQVEQRDSQELQAIRSMLESFGRLRADLEASLSDEVLSLAITMARQIVRQSFALNPEAILPVLREALMVLPALNHQTVLHLHPEDATLVKPLLAQDTVLAQTSWRVVEDGRMERGGCRLETPESEVDATLATRWARVLAALGREDSWQPDKPA